jgi:YHS domain-containing protein
VRCPGKCIQTLGRDGLTAAQAGPVRPGIEPCQGGIHELELLGRPIAEGEVALLGEHLAGRRRLGSIGHLAGRIDRLAELVEEPSPLGIEGGTRSRQRLVIHHVTVRSRIASTHRRAILPGSTRRTSLLAIAIDPVCGMEVDTTTSTLFLEHDGTTYWFCGKGCLLDFQEDPERYLAPDHTPSMSDESTS